MIISSRNRIGLQLYSIRDDLSLNFDKALDKISKIGFDGIELAGHSGIQAAKMKEKLITLHLEPFSCHASVFIDLDYELAYLKEIGARDIICPQAYMVTIEDVRELSEKLNVIGEKAKLLGMNFLYHNHSQEFIKAGKKFLYDYIMEFTDPELVGIELDVAWLKRQNIEIIPFIKQYGNRIGSFHIKEVTADNIGTAKLGSGLLEVHEIIQTMETNFPEKNCLYIFEQNYFEKEKWQWIEAGYTYLRESLNEVLNELHEV